MADQDTNRLKAAIASQAPQLAALLDGPNAPIAVSALGKALLADAQASTGEVADAAQQADPLRLSAAQQQAQLQLRQNSDGDLANLAQTPANDSNQVNRAAGDRADARARQMEMHDTTNQWLAYIVTGTFFVLIVLLMFGARLGLPATGELKDLLFTLLGVVATGWANIVGYYFGSSAGSAQKSQAITAALLQGNPGPNSVEQGLP